MKLALSIALFFISIIVSAQEDPATLSKELTASSKTDLEKVTAIFKWITANISYNTNIRIKQKKNAVALNYTNEDDDNNFPLKPLNDRVAETVIKDRMGFCEGYARLFTTLCDYAGIRSELIAGYATGSMDRPGSRFGTNHYWNAVFIDSSWRLLDATWASGYLNGKGDEFIRQYDDHYFLTSPKDFIRDHYPDDLRWSLLADLPVPKEFHNSPFKQRSFIKYRITSYYPKNGLINASVGDTVNIELETADASYDQNVCPDLLVDSTIFSHDSSWVFLKPSLENGMAGNKFIYSYTVSSQPVEWLYIIYNDDMVLRYKINIRKEKEAGTN